MDAAQAAHSAEHGASTKTRNTNGATKVGAMAAAMGMMIIAIKIHAVDRQPVEQAGIIQGVSDVTVPATLEALESGGAQVPMTQNHTMEGGSAAVARRSPVDGPECTVGIRTALQGLF